MPLSKAKQAEWMKEYRKRLRYNVIPKLDPIPARPDVQTRLEVARKALIVKPALYLNKDEGVIPNYDPTKHHPGDTVRMNGRVVTIPQLDADGQPVFQ